ncbi:MAG: ribosome maturation factor RimM [Candidatus Aminicenantaceae bacterium]
MVSIGRVVRSKGKRGELKLKIYSEHFLKPFFPKVYFQRRSSLEEFEVEYLRAYKKFFLIKLKNIDTLEQASALAGLEVLIPEELLRPLKKDNYYLFQIIGCSVVTNDKRKVGVVADFLFIENNDLLVVMRENKEILIPFIQSICQEVNLQRREITVNPPDGLLDLDEI